MKNLIIYGTFLMGLFFTSCSPIYYVPNSANIPLFTEKGETNLTVAFVNQHEFQGAYAITDHFAIQANASSFSTRNDFTNGGRGGLVEVGAGFFKTLNENTSFGHLVFETYGLLGFGKVYNFFPETKDKYPGTEGKISANVYRIGVQPNLGYKSKYFEGAISTRLALLNYENIRGSLIFEDVNQAKYLLSNASNFLVEPSITLRGGLEKVKLQLQIVWSLNMTNPSFAQEDKALSIGLNFRF